jgi:serine/threonine protein kinase
MLRRLINARKRRIGAATAAKRVRAHAKRRSTESVMEDLQGGLLALEHYYEVGAQQGRGPLGPRYAATQKPLARPVSLWVLSGLVEMGAGEALLERIKRAVWRTSRLDRAEHLHIFDYGQLEDRTPFIVTERAAEMVPLKDWIEDHGALSVSQTLGVLRALVTALNDAYQQAIFHGGLHTGCVWVRRGLGDGLDVKLWGYGMALDRGDLLALDQAMFTTDLVRHLPPEAFDSALVGLNARGESAEAMGEALAADVYGLGCIAYECLTGAHPYFHDARGAADGVLAMMREAPPRLSEDEVSLQQLDEVLGRAIARDPEERFISASSFLSAFDAAIPEALRDKGPLRAHQEAPTSAFGDWLLALLDLAPRRLQLWWNRPGTRRALMGLLLVMNIVLGLALLHVTQTRGEASKDAPAFSPPAATGKGVDVVLLPLRGEEVAQAHIVSRQGEAVPLGPLPYMLRDQRPGERLSFLITTPSGEALQVQVSVRDSGASQWMAIDPDQWRSAERAREPRAALDR